jgi:serine/threonine protein kinase
LYALCEYWQASDEEIAGVAGDGEDAVSVVSVRDKVRMLREKKEAAAVGSDHEASVTLGRELPPSGAITSSAAYKEIFAKLQKTIAEAESARQEKTNAVAQAASVRQELDKALAEVESARQEAREADVARKKAEAEADGLRLELDGARLPQLQPITHAAVRAVLDTPQGLPRGFMRDEESEILDVLKTHNSKERDAPVDRACDLGTKYFRAREDLVNCRLAVENALLKNEGEESREVLEATELRDATYLKYLAASKKLLEACNADNGLVGRVQQRKQDTKACADRLFQLVGEFVVSMVALEIGAEVVFKGLMGRADLNGLDGTVVSYQPSTKRFGVRVASIDSIIAVKQENLELKDEVAQAPSSERRTLVVETLSKHDTWVARKLAQAKERCADVKNAMTSLAELLKTYSEVLRCDDPPLTGALLTEHKPEHQEKALPEDTSPLVVDLSERIAAQESWVTGLSREYQSKVAPALNLAALEAISDLHSESMRYDVLVSAVADAKAVVEYGENPNERVKQGLSEMSSSIRKARRAVRNAQQSRKDAEEDRDDEQRAHWEQQLSKERQKLRTLQQEELTLWNDVYRLAAAAFPELPSQALDSCKASGDRTLSLCDPHAARLLAPIRQFDMYDGPDGGPSPVIISSAGQHSRNDVFSAVYGSKDVCLKRFVLEINNRQNEKVAVRTLQREINSVVKLAHDRVIKPALFFLQAEANGSLCAYVEYPWYKFGSMNKWLGSLPAPEGTDFPKVKVVLWDVSKAIEHVHYHGIVHCDIKLANVLIELTSDGQFRGVLADFDLSKDFEKRLQEASMSAMCVGGACGTPGFLTMAPEVLQGRHPDFKADCYSFGGMVLLALFKSQADSWQQGGDDKRWDSASGAPLLTAVQNEMAHSLLSQALHRDKDRRPTSTQIVSHGFFSADISRAQDLLQNLEQRREELERKQADHAEAVRGHQQHMVDEEQRIAIEQDVLKADLNVRQAQLQREQEELERKERELADQGKLNRDEQKKVRDERKRLETECTKISEEKRRREQDLQKQQLKLDQRIQDEKAKLASERKTIEDRKKEMEKNEREAKGFEVPPYWKNKTGIHFVATESVRDDLQKFMVDSWCCPATKQTRVVSVVRVENESLWQMYQLRRDILKKNCSAQGFRSLSVATNWQPAMPSKAEMSEDINEFYLFHGTSPEMAEVICKHGFDERVAALSGLYGAGSYFAINSCKSHQYSSKTKDSPNFVMLVCRVAMGSPHCTSTTHRYERRPPDNAATPGQPFDSIFAQHGISFPIIIAGVQRHHKQHHNEYVVFDRHQVYPEYIVRYTL